MNLAHLLRRGNLWEPLGHGVLEDCSISPARATPLLLRLRDSLFPRELHDGLQGEGPAACPAEGGRGGVSGEHQ